MKARIILTVLLLVAAGYLWQRRRHIFLVPGVGRIQQAPDSEREYWRGVYERK